MNYLKLKILWFQPKDLHFTFPDLFPQDKQDKQKKQVDQVKEDYQKRMNKKPDRQGIPSWFSGL